MNPVTPRWRFTLAAKFTLLSLAIVLVTTGAISRMIYREEAGEAQAQLMAEGMNLLDMLRHGSSFPLYVQDQAALRNLSLGASHFAGCAYVRYSDPNGEALVDTPFREQVAIPPLAESMEGTESNLFHDHVVSIRRVGSLIDLSMVVSADEDAGQSALFPGRASHVPADVPLGRIQVGLDTAAIDARLRALLGRILF